MKKETIMIDMDDVIVKGRFIDFLTEFLGEVDFKKVKGYYLQDLIKGQEEEFKKEYQYKNLYKLDDGSFIEPLPNCVEVMKKLNNLYDIYIVTSFVWKENIIDASNNLKNKHEYLKRFFPFLDENNFIYIKDKSKISFDIGIDDRPTNLASCNKKIFFTKYANEKITDEELEENNIIKVNDWLEIESLLI